jgi:hypothetical protein
MRRALQRRGSKIKYARARLAEIIIFLTHLSFILFSSGVEAV